MLDSASAALDTLGMTDHNDAPVRDDDAEAAATGLVADPHEMYPNGHNLLSAIAEGKFDGDYRVNRKHNWLLYRSASPTGDVNLAAGKSVGPNVLELTIRQIGTQFVVQRGGENQIHNWFGELRPNTVFHLVRILADGTEVERVQCTVVTCGVTHPDDATSIARVRVVPCLA